MKNNFFQKQILQKALGRHAAKKKKKKEKQTTKRGRKPLRLQVTSKREDYTNKTAFQYSESARRPDAHNFFLWNGGTRDHHNLFNFSKNVFQSLRCRESFSKEWALLFSKGWIKNGLLSIPDMVWISRIKMVLESRALTRFV